MNTYYLLYLIPAILSLIKSNYKWSINVSLIISSIYTLFLGFRYRVGGDWDAYLWILDEDRVSSSYVDIFLNPDPIYYGLAKFLEIMTVLFII